MTIWGYDTVYIEKDPEKREWRVCTPQTRQLLVTVPWRDAFKVFKHAPDYSEAIATCQAHESTALTYEEEKLVLQEEREKNEESLNKNDKQNDKPNDKPKTNVLSLAEFRKKKK